VPPHLICRAQAHNPGALKRYGWPHAWTPCWCRYKLPAGTTDLCPIIHAKPGKHIAEAPSGAAALSMPAVPRLPDLDDLVDKVFATSSNILITQVAGTDARPLFEINKENGRDKVPRGAFSAYVAMSESAAGEVDVALVWRGTQFLEEWETNFAQDELVRGCLLLAVCWLLQGALASRQPGPLARSLALSVANYAPLLSVPWRRLLGGPVLRSGVRRT
jgi:hypothetical protein